MLKGLFGLVMPCMTAFILCQLPLHASGSWYDSKLEGWYYFEEPTSEGDKRDDLTPEEAVEEIGFQKQALNQLLSLALVNPSLKNVSNYMRLQKKVIDQGSHFAGAWQKALLQDPHLGDFLTQPTSHYGLLAKRELEAEARRLFLKQLQETHFLLFFFEGGDPYSEKMGEVLQRFVSLHSWKVQPVSLNGKKLQSYVEFDRDRGISEQIGVQAAPALFVVNPIENKVYPVGAGLLSVSELENNIMIQFEEEGSR